MAFFPPAHPILGQIQRIRYCEATQV